MASTNGWISSGISKPDIITTRVSGLSGFISVANSCPFISGM